MRHPYVRLSPTAYFTAQAWVHEGFPNAELFDTWAGRASFGTAHWVLGRLRRRIPSLSWHEEFLLIRHYAIDARLDALAPTFVLEAGAGLSPRGVTYARSHPEATVVELDLPPMVKRKRGLLRGRGAPSNYHLVAGDVTDPHVLDGLPRTPGATDHAVVITEGVLDYLSMDHKARALSSMSHLLRGASRGHHLFDAYTEERLSRHRITAGTVLGLMHLAGGGSIRDHLFRDAAAARALARRAGYDEVRTLDLDALNTSPYRPPLTSCHFELLEAEVRTPVVP